jgi:hypothetical protein
MTGQRHTSAASRTWLVASGTALGLALALLFASNFASEVVAEQLEEEIDPLPPPPASCRLTGAEALSHARSLEKTARARWERVPFAVEEAPRALLQMAESELCYGVLDRAGRLRSAAQRSEYAAEIVRRFARARLLLRVAVREQRPDRARKQLAVLRALLSTRASQPVQAFRAELEQLDRTYAAQLAERAEESEQ